MSPERTGMSRATQFICAVVGLAVLIGVTAVFIRPLLKEDGIWIFLIGLGVGLLLELGLLVAMGRLPDGKRASSASERGASERGASERGVSERGASERGASGPEASNRGVPERGAAERGAAPGGARAAGTAGAQSAAGRAAPGELPQVGNGAQPRSQREPWTSPQTSYAESQRRSGLAGDGYGRNREAAASVGSTGGTGSAGRATAPASLEDVLRALGEANRRVTTLAAVVDELGKRQARDGSEAAARAAELDGRVAALGGDLGAKLDQLLGQGRVAALRQVAALQQRVQEAREALLAPVSGPGRAMLELLAGFESEYGAQNFAMLGAGMRFVLNDAATKPEFGGAGELVARLRGLKAIDDELAGLTRQLQEGTLEASAVLAGLDTVAQRYEAATAGEPPAMDEAAVAVLQERLLQEVEQEYLAVVQGRAGRGSMEQLASVMARMGFQILDVRLGETFPDPDFHEVVSASHEEGMRAGVIANVVRMGYRRTDGGRTVKARVVVNRG